MNEAELLRRKMAKRSPAVDETEADFVPEESAADYSAEETPIAEDPVPEVDNDHITAGVEMYHNPEARDAMANKPNKTRDDLIGMALMAAIPTLAGGLLGGAGGAAIGAEAGVGGIEQLNKEGAERRKQAYAANLLKQKSALETQKELAKAKQQDKRDLFLQGQQNERSRLGRETTLQAANIKEGAQSSQKELDRLQTLKQNRRTDPINEDYKKIQAAAVPVLELASTPWDKLKKDTVAQLGALTSVNKLFDPSTGVKEGELNNIAGARGLKDKITSYRNRLENGGFLTETEAQQIVSVTKRILESKRKLVTMNDKTYLKDAKDLKLNVSDDVFSDPIEQELEQPQNRALAAPSVSAAQQELARLKAKHGIK